jgi:hypothetical protein
MKAAGQNFDINAEVKMINFDINAELKMINFDINPDLKVIRWLRKSFLGRKRANEK